MWMFGRLHSIGFLFTRLGLRQISPVMEPKTSSRRYIPTQAKNTMRVTSGIPSSQTLILALTLAWEVTFDGNVSEFISFSFFFSFIVKI